MLERRANGLNDVRKQPRQRANVVLAIIQDVALFLIAEGRALQDTIPHIVLASDVDLVFEEVAQGAGERVETLLAVAALDRAVVHGVPKFDVGVERARRFAPAFRSVKAELGGDACSRRSARHCRAGKAGKGPSWSCHSRISRPDRNLQWRRDKAA